MIRRIFLSLHILVLCSVLRAQDSLVVSTPDIAEQQADTSASSSFWHRGLIGKLVNYLDKANTPKPLDKFDFSLIGGPFYNKTAGFGVGLCASALYHLQPTNKSLPQSNFSLTAQLTTKGMINVFARGHNYLPNDRFRSDYEIQFTSFKTEFWGLGFENADNDDNKCFYTRNQIQVTANFLGRLARNLYLGPSVYYSLYYADKREELANILLDDRPHHTSTLGLGINFCYDSRDVSLNPTKGIYLNLEQRALPECFGNHASFTTTELELTTFTPLWKGCVLGGELHTLINCGNNVPWTEFARIGSIFRMRGYYEARYSDRNTIEGQLEFRQHIHGRSGMVLWAGFANAFHDTHTWRFRHTLPNYGIGYRWRFKPDVNIRFDLGVSRNGPGFIFSIGEAF